MKYNSKEIEEILGDEVAYVSAEFFAQNKRNYLNPDYKDDPDHMIWVDLLMFQNAWVACKELYKIND